MNEIRQHGINPITKRKIHNGKLGRILREVATEYGKNPKSLFAPECPSVVVSGKCLKGPVANTVKKLIELEKKAQKTSGCEQELDRLRAEHDELKSRIAKLEKISQNSQKLALDFANERNALKRARLNKISGDYNKLSAAQKNKYNRELNDMNRKIKKLVKQIENVKKNYNKI